VNVPLGSGVAVEVVLIVRVKVGELGGVRVAVRLKVGVRLDVAVMVLVSVGLLVA
jgi:hypothetical protein